MICYDCAVSAKANRLKHDNENPAMETHPPNCGCDCQHRDPDDWEAMYSVPRP